MNMVSGQQDQSLVSAHGAVNDETIRTAKELLEVQRRLGISIGIKDKNLNTITARFNSPSDLFSSPEFIAALSQQLYVSDPDETTWFKLSVRNGRFKAITFLFLLKILWVKIINKRDNGFDFLLLAYMPGEGDVKAATAVIPEADFAPCRIWKHFTFTIGENAMDLNECGKLICYILQKKVKNPNPEMLEYVSQRQGFAEYPGGRLQFNPPRLLRKELALYFPEGLRSRQYPYSGSGAFDKDMTPFLKPLFEGKRELQLLLLVRIASWHSFLYAKRNIISDIIFICKMSAELSLDYLEAVLNNTKYIGARTPAIGPNIKALRFDLENINDGIVFAIDPFRVDQQKKAERGYDLLINDASRASSSQMQVNHILVLASSYADQYIPSDRSCVMEFEKVHVEHTAEEYKNALRRLDENLIRLLEHGYSRGDYVKAFNNHIDVISQSLPKELPRSKVTTFLMLITALRMYEELFTPLFSNDIVEFITNQLSGQANERQPTEELICLEFNRILNLKIANGYYRLIPKEKVTQYDKGSHQLIVDKEKQLIFMETADTDEVVCDMETISNPDILKSVLYDSGYIPHNSKGEKSVRIAAITSSGLPYPLYVQALSFALLTPENRQRLDLIDKDSFLFHSDEFSMNSFLPMVKTVDGRFAGKQLNFEAESSHHYLGTGRSGSGKSWALGQLMPMLRMLNCNVVVFDTSGSFTEVQLRKMLPSDVVDRMFRFVHIGVEQDRVPVDLGSLSGCMSLPDRKRAVYTALSSAVGKFDRDRSKDNQQRTALKSYLSQYLKDKRDRVDFVELTEKLRSSSLLSPRVSEVLSSVFQDIADIGYEEQGWDDLFSDDNRILVLDLGNEVGDSSHVLLDILVASLYGWQYQHNERQLAIFIDELADQNFAEQSPLNMILKQGRKQHIMLLGATQDYFGQGNSSLDVLKQTTIKSYARPGKSEDRIAEKLGFANAIDAGFHHFRPGDVIVEFDAYNKETGENEPVTLRGRVVDFVETPFYAQFKRNHNLVEQSDSNIGKEEGP